MCLSRMVLLSQFLRLSTPGAATATRVSDLGLEEQQVPNAIGFDAGTHHPAKRGCRAMVVSRSNTHTKKKKHSNFVALSTAGLMT